jgi:hypothetical protein
MVGLLDAANVEATPPVALNATVDDAAFAAPNFHVTDAVVVAAPS